MSDKIKTIEAFDAMNPNMLIIRWADKEITTVDLDEIPEGECPDRMKHHGAKQKFGDACSGGFKEYGDVAGCREKVEETIEHVLNGMWNKGRASRGRLLFEAMAEVWDSTIETAKEIYDSSSEDVQDQLAKHPEVELWFANRALARATEKLETAEETIDVAKLFAK